MNTRRRSRAAILEVTPEQAITRRRALELARLAGAHLQITAFTQENWAHQIKRGDVTADEVEWMRINLLIEPSLRMDANLVDTQSEIRSKVEEIKELLKEVGDENARISVSGSFVHIDESNSSRSYWNASTANC